MIKIETLSGGTKKVSGRALSRDTGNAPGVRLLSDTGFFPKDENVDLYQHQEGFAILVNSKNFEVSEFIDGKITISMK